jgi:hypothetical protein
MTTTMGRRKERGVIRLEFTAKYAKYAKGRRDRRLSIAIWAVTD